jgi:hypothetical protein
LRKIEKWRLIRPAFDSERLISRNAREYDGNLLGVSPFGGCDGTNYNFCEREPN